MPPTTPYDRPFHWWGPGWDNPVPRNLADLLRDGTLEPAATALLWASLARRCSLAVIGSQAALGKTTLLTALLPLLPADTRHIFLRGCFEPFAFLDDPTVDPTRTALLVNEISPHLPVYLWGPAVSRALDAAQRGFTFLATAHGDSVQEFVASLTGSPLRIPATSIATFDLVAILAPSPATASGRHLREIWRLEPTRDGLTIDRVDIAAHSEPATPSEEGTYPLLTAAASQRMTNNEMAARCRCLCSLRDGLSDRLPSEPGQDARGAAPASAAVQMTSPALATLSHRPNRV